MNLQDYVKKYVWDEEKTPYFRSVRRLTKANADSEMLIYAAFVGGIFSVMELITASQWAKTSDTLSGAMAFYCAFVVAGAFVLWRKKDVRAALICLTAPIATAANFIFDGMHGELGQADMFILIGFCLLWLRYGVRVISICLKYDNMPQRPTDK